MRPVIAFDITRLLLGPFVPSPRGIDRVDLGYAAHFLGRWRGDSVATVLTPFGVRAIDREEALRVIDRVIAHWGEEKDPDSDAIFGYVKARLSGASNGNGLPPNPPRAKWVSMTRGALKSAALGVDLLSPRIARKVPRGALYLNTGQIGIANARMLSWLERRRDVKPVMMLHDTIPLDYPEFVTPLATRMHGSMIANTARLARGLIVTTEAVRRSVLREIERRGRRDMPVVAAPLPVDSRFLEGNERDRDLARHCYFVVCGSIEPRKNHKLLLDVWKALAARTHGPNPKLVIVGTPWRDAESVTDALARSEDLQRTVILAAGLSTPALRRLIGGATALLMPSFAEGFGLPIVEALAQGTPVIASDLAAHREAGGHFAAYSDPRDGAAWLRAIEEHAQDALERRRRLADRTVFTWDDYARRIEPFIERIWRGSEPPAELS